MNITITYDKKITRKITIHNRDLISLDQHLAHIILAALRKYRKTQGLDGVGYPLAFNSQWDSHTYSKKQEEADVARWLHALDTMIYAFESIVKDRIVLASHEKAFKQELDKLHKAHKRSKKSTLFFQEDSCFKKLYDDYASNMQQQTEQVKTGLQLFAEHFRSLYC